LYAPAAGRLTEFNEALLSDPSTINVDKYGGGWLFHLEGAGEGLLRPEEYLVHLEGSWAIAQRTIKGQMNEE
jgi:glycine cleavage system H protein